MTKDRKAQSVAVYWKIWKVSMRGIQNIEKNASDKTLHPMPTYLL